MNRFQQLFFIFLSLPLLFYVGLSSPQQEKQCLFEWEWQTATQQPKENEKRILLPMEKWLMNLPYLEKIKSQSSATQVKITAIFSKPYSQKLYNELKASTLLLGEQFPIDVSKPLLRAIQTERPPDLVLLAHEKEDLPPMHGVSKIEKSGALSKEYALYLQKMALNSFQEFNSIANWIRGWNCQENLLPITIGEKSYPTSFSSTPFPFAIKQQFQEGILIQKQEQKKEGIVFSQKESAQIHLLYFKKVGSLSYYYHIIKGIHQLDKKHWHILHNEGKKLFQNKLKEALLLIGISLLILFFLPRYTLSFFQSFCFYSFLLLFFPATSHKMLFTLLYFASISFLFATPYPNHIRYWLFFLTLPSFFLLEKDFPTALRGYLLLLTALFFYHRRSSSFHLPQFRPKKIILKGSLLIILLTGILFLYQDFEDFSQITILFPPQLNEKRIQQEMETLLTPIKKVPFSLIDKNQFKIYFEKNQRKEQQQLLQLVNQMPKLYGYRSSSPQKSYCSVVLTHPKREAIESFPKTLAQINKLGFLEEMTTSQVFIQTYLLCPKLHQHPQLRAFQSENILTPYLTPLIDKILEAKEEYPIKIIPSSPNPLERGKLSYHIQESHQENQLYRQQFQPAIQISFFSSNPKKKPTAIQKQFIQQLKAIDPLFATEDASFFLKEKEEKGLTIFLIPLFLRIIMIIIGILLRIEWIQSRLLKR